MPLHGDRPVPVLMYHHINDSDDWFATSESSLIAQIDWLAANGYETITPSTLVMARQSGAPLPQKAVMITIDDGNQTDHIFAQVLATHDFHGVYFWPDTSPLTEAEMFELAAMGEVGAHTRTHPDLRTLSDASQRSEIAENRQRLQQVTGQPIRAFAYPFGTFNAASTEVVKELGFDLAFDANGIPTAFSKIDRFHVPRFEIPNGISLRDFITRVESWR